VSDAPQYLFEVETPLGFKVHCTEDYWQFITTKKHPSMVDRLEDVKQTLIDPDEIRQSLSDDTVLLFYRSDKAKRKRWTCAVSKRLESEGFLITAYPTGNIKEGERIWSR
jgi:hypothetical protein